MSKPKETETEIHVAGVDCAVITPWNMALIFLIRLALHAAVVLAFARWRAVPGSWAIATLVLLAMPGIERLLAPVFLRLGLWRPAHEDAGPS
jgi:hypothetical protein